MISADPQFSPKQKKLQTRHGDRLVQWLHAVIRELRQLIVISAGSKRVHDIESLDTGVP